MDRFTTLEPVKLYATAATSTLLGRGAAKTPNTQHFIGRLPVDLHISILIYLAIPDVLAYSRASRMLAELARDEHVWKAKWDALGIDASGLRLDKTLDELEARAKGRTRPDAQPPPPPPTTEALTASSSGDFDDDFGDFASGTGIGSAPQDLFGAFQGDSLSLHPAVLTGSSQRTYRRKFIHVHTILKALLPNLSSPPHLVLSTLFPAPSPPLLHQSHTLHLLALYLSPAVRPVRNHETLYAALRSAVDRFQAGLLTAFDVADGKKDEAGMREAALASWEVWEGHLSERAMPVADWELGRVWADKREVFYEQGRWKPLENFTKDGELDFDAMDEFMVHVLDALRTDGATAVNVFPAASYVILSFADRLAMEVVGEYITSLLTKAREISNEVFLKAAAATFREAWRMVDVLLSFKKDDETFVTRTQAEDVVFQMFELNMDEYLDEEVETVKQAFEAINRDWERKISAQTSTTAPNAPNAARFLGSHNPAQLKRTVLASFTDVLLLPVTIVPRTVGAVGAALTTGGSAAVQGIAMLNPQRWVSQAGTGATSGRYSSSFGKEDAQMVFEVGDEDQEEEEEKEKEVASITRSSISSSSQATREVSTVSSVATSVRSSSPPLSTSKSASRVRGSGSVTSFDQMELLLSLDVALELIHADREALKRVETFAAYPGAYGHRVRDTIEEVFILLLQAMGGRHISPGFEKATEQMRTYKPAEHEETMSVAPLMQFFELVHVGDTIQSMVQVYFDKELKKRFENVLDDSVAAGMNAGTDVLMNQVEHIILMRTQAREYYPVDDEALDLGPTQGCTEAVACLDMHCRLLKGSTSKEVLEVFYEEVGIRLLAILHRHIKRQIISLAGGFQVIADLNAYHTFISSLKVPSITSDFSNLKMLGHVYVVEDAKDLAQIVRDVTRYGGAYRPEDIYEFIQRRADWKKIEKTVDKTMYNLSFKEDCIIC
ncbi:exocyst complex component Sec10-like protein [Phellopilus nigrolimitatus]|nr:exocyst complex component Sec10-like protein [Phellopilus nigrolimitatus]